MFAEQTIHSFVSRAPTVGDFLPFYRAIALGNLMALFLLPIAGTKEKAKQKENAVKELSPSAEGDQRLCLWIPQAFEKA